MTNHWTDIDNTSLVFAYGANPAENHPACMAHINAARFGSKKARLIVVDPRLTRTARQCDPNRTNIDGVLEPDFYVRIRPGTNVAFTNGLLNWIYNNGSYDAQATRNMLAWHNGFKDAGFPSDPAPGSLSLARTFVDDKGNTLDVNTVGATASGVITLNAANLANAKYDGAPAPQLVAGYPKYCDSRFKVNPAGDDYVRENLTVGPNAGFATDPAYRFSEFPVIVANVDDVDCVFQKLKAHVAPYDVTTVADICGCTEADIANVAKALVDNSRFKSTDFGVAQATPTVQRYRATTILYAMGQTQHTNGSQNIKDLAILQTLMGNMGRPGGGINALRGIHNVQGSTDWGLLYDSIPGYSGNPAVGETYEHYSNTLFGNRVMSKAAAGTVSTPAPNSKLVFTAKTGGLAGNAISVAYVDPGLTDQTISVAVVGSAITVTLATGPAGGITSTGALVKAAIEAFPAASALVAVTFATGNTGAGVVAAIGPVLLVGGSDGKNYKLTASLGIQQRGFQNMTQEWFGNGTVFAGEIDKLYSLWPKGNGVQHIQTFRYMAASTDPANLIKAALIWGQNPAVTEPNQSAVRLGLENLDLMVVVDMYLTETGACGRKAGAPTYLIPTSSHVEEAGSVTNSGRWLQWRERATKPKGNSKADIELMLRFAYALDKAQAFTHITNVPYNGAGTDAPTSGVWSTLLDGASAPAKINGPAYKNLYGDRYQWTPGVSAFESVSVSNVDVWHAGATAPVLETVTGSEAVCELVYREFARPLNQLADGSANAVTGGTMWIYSGSDAGATAGVGGYNGGPSAHGDVIPNAIGAAWAVNNRAKSRNNAFKGAATNGANNFPRWGWAWLYNRRVFYNNGEIAADQSDTFVSPGVVSLMFTEKSAPDAGLTDWSLVYRKYKTFADVPSVVPAGVNQNLASPHFVSGSLSYAGRFPGHTEPTESPRDGSDGKPNLVALWGHNTSGGNALYWTGLNPTVPGVVADFPLVLTSIRCVEHFQGGPTTRNNSWNVEAEPVPWIEINSTDARAAVPPINDGDWVNITTARSNSTTDQMGTRSPNSGTTWARGFKARVGVGLQSNQRVGPGVVAIPWHWGDKGLSTGSRANDLCIDAWDANTQIPEYKACLCKIEKIPNI